MWFIACTCMSLGLGRSLWRAPHTHVRLCGAALALSRAGPGPGAPGELDHRVPRCLSSAVYVLDVRPWPQVSAASAARVAV